MNSLDFIDKEIKATESAIDGMQEMLDNRVYCYFNKESILDSLNEGKKRLQTLQQIKVELEAWKVVKSRLRKEKYTSAYIHMNSITKDHPDYRVVNKVWKVEI